MCIPIGQRARAGLGALLPARPPLGRPLGVDWRLGHRIRVKGANRRDLQSGLREGSLIVSLTAPAIVVVPTYCEAEALPHFVDRFAPTGLELLIVDDASPDGTGQLADALAADRPWMHVLHRAGKDGLGMAYRAGFRWCLDRGYRAIGQMDSDLSHPPEKLTEMLAVLETREADLVLGNRYMPGGGTAGWSRARRALSRIGCTGSKLILGLPFDDLSGGFKLWRATTLAGLDFDAMLATGYAFQVETTQLAYLMGKRIEQVPFVFSERVAGESKMSLAVSLEGIRVTLALRRRARAHRGPRTLAA
jgi:dolichol-phosphate mannosyltransferase